MIHLDSFRPFVLEVLDLPTLFNLWSNRTIYRTRAIIFLKFIYVLSTVTFGLMYG